MPIWGDPRIHYVINCASYGCPNLYGRALTGQTIEKRLNAAAKDFINSDRAISFKDGNLHVSSIYRWFADDFGGTDARVIKHLRIFAEPALSKRLSEFSRIKGDYYDWSLNEIVGPVQGVPAQSSPSLQP